MSSAASKCKLKPHFHSRAPEPEVESSCRRYLFRDAKDPAVHETRALITIMSPAACRITLHEVCGYLSTTQNCNSEKPLTPLCRPGKQCLGFFIFISQVCSVSRCLIPLWLSRSVFVHLKYCSKSKYSLERREKKYDALS